jgi:DNA-binding transcriptional regulator YiaG
VVNTVFAAAIATQFGELRAEMSLEARAEARRLADKDLKVMPLHELRSARHLTQQQLAKTLDMTQAAVSQLAQRTDISTSARSRISLRRWAGGWKCTPCFPMGK